MPASESSAPATGSRLYVLLILTLVYAFNHIDRQVLLILLEPIKTDLNLKDVTVEPAKAVIKWEVLERAAEIALTSLSLVDNVGGA